MKKRIFFILIFCVCIWPLHAAVILKTKGKKALVDLEGVQADKGDTFSAINLYGKALGLLQIKKVKRGKALAVLLEGKMGPNWMLEPNANASKRFLASVEEYHEGGQSDIYSTSHSPPVENFYPSSGFGLVAGLNLNIITLSASKNITGRSPNGSLFLDFSFMDSSIVEPGLRLFLGYQQLRAQGKNCGRPCSLIVHYPGAGILLRAVFLKNIMFQPWLGGGGFLFWPLVDKQHDLGLDKKSFESFHGSLTGALGLDFHFKGFYIPIQVGISWINPVLISLQAVKPNSKEFKPLYMEAKLGFAFSF